MELTTLPSTLDSTTTSVQFVIMSLALAFDLKPKQAFALLSNNLRYLLHICIRGTKGKQYEKVLKWY